VDHVIDVLDGMASAETDVGVGAVSTDTDAVEAVEGVVAGVVLGVGVVLRP